MGYNVHALGCGCTGIGSTSLPAGTTLAGEIGGIQTLAIDLKNLANQLKTGIQNVVFNKPLYDVTLAKFRTPSAMEAAPPTAAEIHNFLKGALGQIGDALIRAKQLAQIPVRTQAERTANQAAQAALIGPAQLLWDSLHQVVSFSPASSTSGLGFIPILIGIVVVAIIVGVAAVAAGAYLADSSMRLQVASAAAQHICQTAHPPCTPQQYADIERELGLTPVESAAVAGATAAGQGISTAVIALGGLGLAAAIGLFFYFRYEAKLTGYVAKKLGANRRYRRLA